MDLDRAMADLPMDTQSYIRTCLTDHHIKNDDPIVAIMLMVAQTSRRPRFPIFAMAAVSTLLLCSTVTAWFMGVAHAQTEAYKPRPMVTFTIPGTSILYGAQAGRQVFMVDCSPKTVESTWVSKGMAYVSVK